MALQTKSISANGANGHHKFTLTVTEDSTNTSGNTSTIAWSFVLSPVSSGWDWSYSSTVPVTYSVTINGTKYTGNIMKYNGTSTVTVKSGTETVAHDADGNKSISYSFSVSSLNYSYLPGTASDSGSMALTFIARASQPSCVTWPDHTQNVGSFGDTISIHMNRKSDSFTHTVRYAFGSKSGTCINADTGKAATGITTGVKWKIPEDFMSLLPSVTTGSGTIYVDTYNGTTLIGTKYCGFTATVPSSVKPSCSIQVLDDTGVNKIYGSLVKGLSKLYVKTTGTQAYSSPIKSYNVTANGTNYYASEIVTGVLAKSGTTTITAKVTDSRGRTSNVASASFAVLDYSAPSISKLTAIRCDADGTPNKRGQSCKVTLSATVSGLDGKNTALYKLYYKKTTEEAYTEVSLIDLTNNYAPTNYEYIFSATPASSYDVVLDAIDRHNSNNPTEKSVKLPTASSIFSWRGFKTASGVEDGAGIGKVPEKPNTLQVGWDSEFESSVRGKVYGLGTLEPIPEDSDLNNYTVPGVYSVATDEIAATIFNMPMTVAGRLVVSDSTGTEPKDGGLWEYKEQLFLPHDIGRGSQPWVRQIRRAGSTTWTYYDWRSFALFAYPIGSIYIAYNHISPAVLFGGTWERISNRFLWGVDENGGVGVVGGEKTHTLTSAEMPAHSHGSVYSQHAQGVSKQYAWYTEPGTSIGYGSYSVGENQPHNNMPPYIQVSIWRRTA